MRGDAVLAGAQDRVGPVEAFERSATRSRSALVACVSAGCSRAGIAEVSASRSLQQVPAGGGHVAQLGGSSGQKRLRKYRIIVLHVGIPGEVGIANQGADAQASAGEPLNFVQWQEIDVDEP